MFLLKQLLLFHKKRSGIKYKWSLHAFVCTVICAHITLLFISPCLILKMTFLKCQYEVPGNPDEGRKRSLTLTTLPDGTLACTSLSLPLHPHASQFEKFKEESGEALRNT